MNDDQMIALLRDVPLPGDPVDRYASVQARGRARDRRRTTVLAASLAVVVVAGATTALTWRGEPAASPQTFLKLTTSAGSAHVTGHVEFGGQEQTFVGDIDFAHDAARITSTGMGQDIEIRSIGRDIYIKGFELGFGSGAPAGKHWMHSTSDSGGSSDITAFDPGRVLDTLRAQHATLTARGREEINGVSTTDYVVSGAKSSESGPFTDGTGHVYVGDDGLVRRMTFAEASFRSDSSGTSRGSETATTTMDFGDYGKPVDIQAPPASDTYDEQSSFGGTTSLTSSAEPMDSAAKARLCRQIRASIDKLKNVPQAKKDELIHQFCTK